MKSREAQEQDPRRNSRRRTPRRFTYLVVAAAGGSFLLFVAFRLMTTTLVDVPTHAMTPTVLAGDRILINTAAYDLSFPFSAWQISSKEPQWGEVVLFRSPEDGLMMVARIVGLPGDLIELRSNELHRNGQPAAYSELRDIDLAGDFEFDEPAAFYTEELDGRKHPIMITGNTLDLPGPFYLPRPDSFFLLGDNRNKSRDSRFFGPINRSEIFGRVSMVLMSLDRADGLRPRWGRFLTRVE